MAISLGRTPDKLTVILTPGSTFAAKGTRDTGTWSVGDTLKLTFDVAAPGADIEWAATLSGADANWTMSPSNVNAVIASDATKVRLWYSDGTNPIELAYGDVRVKP